MSAMRPTPERSSASTIGPALAKVSLGEIGGEHVAAAKVLVPPVPHVGAEHMIEGGFAGLQGRDEIGPGLPILLDHDQDFLAEPRGRARLEGLAEAREREAAVGALLADAEGHKPAQEAEEVRRR